MKILSKQAQEKAETYIVNNGRYIEKLLLEHWFYEPCPSKISKALEMYQNKDGGYGNGLEPDFRMPFSSAVATAIALGILKDINALNKKNPQVEKAIAYLCDTYNDAYKGWIPVPQHVNLYPHAPWWHQEKVEGEVDGNPSAELAGYLYVLKEDVTKLDINQIVTYYLDRLKKIKTFEEHELICYTKMYDVLPNNLNNQMTSSLIEGYHKLVNTNVSDWTSYVPYPLKFISITEKSIFPVTNEDLNTNLDYIVEHMEEAGVLSPTWKWNQYTDEWQIAEREWKGKLTLDHLLILKRFNRLE
ncbi:hypothetical protein [Fusibacter tunisiensis]|uniref:Terpene cyclase/mutase family protein n=1 Tax=Fusibacter tunisiensis TaxID=1008308 RepID=A0ABS2MML9_9FIRM|nr:hypothetical protein [Fusibacter tunisiensis]MBM7560647.1 hypothetical protein [Fusibacter tunisiensis]